jgi:uncharacterized membrane protein YgcG
MYVKLVHRLRRLALPGFFGLLLCLLGPAATARADVNDFTVTYFGVDYTLSAADPQGELHIVERIKVHFNDQNHGLLRAIPQTYKNHQLQMHVVSITSETQAPSKYSTYNQNGNTVLKIGDAKKTITGDQEYTIDYTLRNVISFYADHDELYWDINGTDWQQPFQGISATLHLPKGLKLSKQQVVCYSGSYGSTGNDCESSVHDDGGSIRVNSVRQMDAGENISFVAGFNKGFFQPSRWTDTVGEYARGIVEIIVPTVLIGGIGGVYWWRRGRDAKGKGIIVPQYDAPPGLHPLQVGTLIDFKTDNVDMTATIIDLAVRGYLTITEHRKDHVLGKDTFTYTLKLTKDDTKDLEPYAATLLTGLFPNFQLHETVSLEFMKYKLSQQSKTIRSAVSADLYKQGFFRNNPFKLLNRYSLGLYVTILTAVIVLSSLGPKDPALWCGMGAGLAILFIFMHFMPARTLKGSEAKEHILGLKLYLKTAEADRIKMMQSPGASYVVTKQPERTVELFEKLLPYAIVLGVEKEWAKQFEDLYKSPPDWYQGHWNSFSAGYLVSSISDGMVASVNTVFASPASSSSSGFGGDGFSGGGGGGGGGGGW